MSLFKLFSYRTVPSGKPFSRVIHLPVPQAEQLAELPHPQHALVLKLTRFIQNSHCSPSFYFGHSEREDV